MYQRFIIAIFILCICIVVIGSGTVLYREEVLRNIGTASDKYVSEYFAEYVKWEYDMINDNPNYDDLKILIDVAEKRLYLLNGNELIKTYPIASGKASTPSPLGSWKIVNKARWGGGFGTRWMGLNVPWSTYQEEYPKG